MKVLVLGASGATGRLVVRQLTGRNISTKIVVRERDRVLKDLLDNNLVECIAGSIGEFDRERNIDLVRDCDAVICCLGHNINFKGIFCPPRKLVYNAVVEIIDASQSLNLNQKFILMSTTAYTNRKRGEANTIGEKIIFSLLKVFLPPHRDNMLAADHLVYKLNSMRGTEWVAVRPDSLFDEDNVTRYETHDHKMRSPIFNPGRTSRINAAHFMAELATDDKLWNEWKFKTPVIYNKN